MNHRGLAAAVGAGLLAAAPAERLPLDHVMVGVADLEQGIVEVNRRTGAKLVPGGVHPGGGTRNALMSLGDDTYLEVIAPDPAQAVDNADVRGLKALKVPTPIGWALRTTDAPRLVRRLARAGLAARAVPGSRRLPDGTRLGWTFVSPTGIDDPIAPFFIGWATMATHPSRTSPGGCHLARLSLDDPRPGRLASLLALAPPQIRLRRATVSRLRLDLDCPGARVSF